MDYQNDCATSAAANPSDQAGRMNADVYMKVSPYVQEAIESICGESLYYLSDADVERLSDEVIRKSNAYNGMPAGHSRETVSDLTRALVLQGLLDKIRRRRSMPFFAPMFFYPIDDRDRSRDNDRTYARPRDRERDYDYTSRERDCDHECFRDRERDRYLARDKGRGWY